MVFFWLSLTSLNVVAVDLALRSIICSAPCAGILLTDIFMHFLASSALLVLHSPYCTTLVILVCVVVLWLVACLGGHLRALHLAPYAEHVLLGEESEVLLDELEALLLVLRVLGVPHCIEGVGLGLGHGVEAGVVPLLDHAHERGLHVLVVDPLDGLSISQPFILG